MGFIAPSRVRIPPSPLLPSPSTSHAGAIPNSRLKARADCCRYRQEYAGQLLHRRLVRGPRKVVIWVTGDLDADTARAVRARLAQAQRHARSDVIIDMTGVTFVDTVGLSAIVNGAKALNDYGMLRVISPP